MTDTSKPAERAKKGMSLVLKRMAEGTQAALAVSMGVSESTVNRIKTERLEEVLLLLAHLGLKTVPTDFKCVDRESYDFLVRSHTRVMEKAPQLIWDADE
jgi:DNA-binding XRE family transcriptional regulator